jgi:TonB family protein
MGLPHRSTALGTLLFVLALVPVFSVAGQEPQAAPAFRVPPQPIYPIEALRNGIEGRCEVRFTVDAQGVPQNVTARCTHPVFEAPARQAMLAVRLDMSSGIAAGASFLLPLGFQLGE